MDGLYRDILLDHYNNSCNRKILSDADFIAQAHNTSCGDSVVLYGKIKQHILLDLTFTGSGCVISQATASLLCERVKNKDIASIRALDQEFLKSMIGISLGPVRLKCALLSLDALCEGIKDSHA